MAAPSQVVTITKASEEGVLQYMQSAKNMLTSQFSLRAAMEQIDRYYMRETDQGRTTTRARVANRLGNKKHIQDVTIPIVMPQVEAALGYLANVFVTGYPIFGVAGDPENEDAALQLETIVAENAVMGRWGRQLLMFFRDGLKYNLHGLEVDWKQKNVAAIETDINATNSAAVKQNLWKGNCIRRMDLYNTFMDPRVHPAEIHESGEFAGYVEIFSRMRLKKFINDLGESIPPSTIARAFQASPSPSTVGSTSSPYSYYIPIINPYPIMANQNATQFDWMAWATAARSKNLDGLRYGNVYEVTTLYARIMPSDFSIKVPAENTPQVWKFVIVNGTVLLYAERQSNAHGYIPIVFGQPMEDGLDYQTKSFAQNVMDMQDVGSAMWNGYIASKRRLVGDRVLYDPLRIREADINSTDPAAKIPVRPSAYGKPVNEAVYQFPFHDEQTASLVQGADAVTRFANLINGQNPAQQGQFVKGNKTKTEYQDIMGHGNDHNQIIGISTEQQVFTPLKEILLLNILQYQEADTIYNKDRGKTVAIDPVSLRKQAVHFKIADGMLPEDKQLSTEEFQVAMQVIGSTPGLAGGYNLAQMFSYMMKLRGADLKPFEKSPLQQQYEQQVGAWQQAAAMAAQKGAPFNTPMPQMPPALQQELQAKAGGSSAGPATSPEGQAAESTQG